MAIVAREHQQDVAKLYSHQWAFFQHCISIIYSFSLCMAKFFLSVMDIIHSCIFSCLFLLPLMRLISSLVSRVFPDRFLDKFLDKLLDKFLDKS